MDLKHPDLLTILVDHLLKTKKNQKLKKTKNRRNKIYLPK